MFSRSFIERFQQKMDQRQELVNDPALKEFALNTCTDLVFKTLNIDQIDGQVSLYRAFHKNCCSDFCEQIKDKPDMDADEYLRIAEEIRKRNVLGIVLAQSISEEEGAADIADIYRIASILPAPQS